MAMKPVCPECGSVRVAVGKKTAACMEPDCGHVGHANQFKGRQQLAEHIDAPHTEWRDPVAMSMDGYDE